MTTQHVLEKLALNEEFTERYDVNEFDGAALLTAKDYGDLPIWLVADAETTTFKSTLVAASEVGDSAEFNSFLLRAMASAEVALSSFGIETDENGEDVYVIIGTLSSDSKPEVMLTEVNTLASNAIEMLTTVLA